MFDNVGKVHFLKLRFANVGQMLAKCLQHIWPFSAKLKSNISKKRLPLHPMYSAGTPFLGNLRCLIAASDRSQHVLHVRSGEGVVFSALRSTLFFFAKLRVLEIVARTPRCCTRKLLREIQIARIDWAGFRKSDFLISDITKSERMCKRTLPTEQLCKFHSRLYQSLHSLSFNHIHSFS